MTAGLRVESAAFEHGAPIPRRYTADGEDVSPPLAWSRGPPGTRSYALVMEDPDAPGGTWVHWLVWNLGAIELPEDAAGREWPLAGATEGRNSWRRAGYGGPAPPRGTHRYVFRVYALDARLDLRRDADAPELLRAIRGHELASGELTGTYARRG